MPEDFRDFMIAMGVVQDYSVRLALGAQRKERDALYEVTFRMQERFKYFEPCLQVVRDNVPIFDYTGWNEQARGDFDCYIDFDNQRAKALTYVFNAHATEGLGVLIGCGPLGIITGADIPHWPMLGPLGLTKDIDLTKRVCIINWDNTYEESHKFKAFLNVNYPHLCVNILEGSYEVEQLVKLILNYDVVLGKAGVETYIAACLTKTVIEIYPTKEDAIYYNSMGIPIYQCIVSDHTSAEFMWSVWEKLWDEHQGHLFATKSDVPLIQTIQSPSIVDSVVEK